MAEQRTTGGQPLSHNGRQHRAEEPAGAVNKIRVTIVTGEVGRGWGGGGGSGGRGGTEALGKLEEDEVEGEERRKRST